MFIVFFQGSVKYFWKNGCPDQIYLHCSSFHQVDSQYCLSFQSLSIQTFVKSIFGDSWNCQEVNHHILILWEVE